MARKPLNKTNLTTLGAGVLADLLLETVKGDAGRERWVRMAPAADDGAAALTGLAPVARDSGTLHGKRAIAGGRRALRHVLFQAALVAAHHNQNLKSFADRLRKAGKPHKVIITAVARKLVTIANALCKNRQKWVATTT